jgi:hypothetical protein
VGELEKIIRVIFALDLPKLGHLFSIVEPLCIFSTQCGIRVAEDA